MHYKDYYSPITTAWNQINNNLHMWLDLLKLSSHQTEKKDSYQHHFLDEKYQDQKEENSLVRWGTGVLQARRRVSLSPLSLPFSHH